MLRLAQTKNSALFVSEHYVRDPDAAVAVVPSTKLAAHLHWHCGAVETLGKVARVPERIATYDLGRAFLVLAHERRFARVDDPGRDRVDSDKVGG